MRHQGVAFRVVEPYSVHHCRIDVENHDVTPIWCGTVSARAVYAERAHSKSDRTCGGSVLFEYSRVDRRSLSTSIRGLPPVLRGGGSAMASTASAGATATTALARMPAFASRRDILVTPIIEAHFILPPV